MNSVASVNLSEVRKQDLNHASHPIMQHEGRGEDDLFVIVSADGDGQRQPWAIFIWKLERVKHLSRGLSTSPGAFILGVEQSARVFSSG